ncbi:MAG: YqeG family HAD IIIA-type phosphatase [Coriobacteriales bacterium]|jgi:HAD superfamily phosphatase (TIGR01668 family)|nr:YqeG family HAD IIIA-type phosphatase [Coriobacteriales bacterium]
MPLFKPDAYLASVTRIDPVRLAARGTHALLIDIDNTLVPRDTHVLSPEVIAWVAHAKASGLKVCLLSNNWHRVVFGYAAQLDVPIVYKAMKPAPFAFLHALKKIAEKPATTVVVGDQLMTDVLGAHLLHMPAILVEPLSHVDLWYTQLFRRIEHRLVGDLQPDE